MVHVKYEPAGEGLPNGWLKECRPRKKPGSRMGDMFYIDPIHGYEFRSLKAAHRYLQSGDISECVMLSNKRKIKDLHSTGDLSHHTGRLSDRVHLDTANELNKYKIGGNESLGDAWLSTERGSSKSDNVNPIQRESEIQLDSKEHTPGEAESVTRKGTNIEQKTKQKKRKAKLVKQIATHLRSSPRLAALKMIQEAKNTSRDGHTSVQTDIADQLRPKQVKNPMKKTKSSVLPEKNDGTLSPSEKTEDNYSLVPNQIRPSVPCSSADVGCQNALAGVPVLPQQVELGGTNSGMPGSALSSLFRHVWSDPCLQFAFRTLTGDIPVFNDNLAAANYFLPQQNLDKGATPDCSSSAYDCTRNHVQVDHVSLSLLRPSDKLYGGSWFPPQ